jgi:hypothetical protein
VPGCGDFVAVCEFVLGSCCALETAWWAVRFLGWHFEESRVEVVLGDVVLVGGVVEMGEGL